MSRRERRRRRARQAEARAQVVPAADTPVNWSRLRQMFSTLSHRGTKLFRHHVLAPAVVDASSPEEMIEATERALIEAVENEPKN